MTATTLSLQGRSLKLDSRADIEPHLADVDPTKIETVIFSGNSLGVEASLAIAEFLQKANAIKVRQISDFIRVRWR
jgi:Ran GTPase-activating protein 1